MIAVTETHSGWSAWRRSKRGCEHICCAWSSGLGWQRISGKYAWEVLDPEAARLADELEQSYWEARA